MRFRIPFTERWFIATWCRSCAGFILDIRWSLCGWGTCDSCFEVE